MGYLFPVSDMAHHTFILTSDYIELNKLLKIYDLVESGWHAKTVITEWLVSVNGHVEYRIRNKLVAGDVVVFNDSQIIVQQP